MYVAFLKTIGVRSIGVQLLAGARTVESLSDGDTSTGAAQDGEIVFILNDGDATMLVATGTTPDGSLTDATSVSSAGVPLGAGQSAAFALNTGDKVGVKAAS